MDITLEHKSRAAYMLLWFSRKSQEPSYSAPLLGNILRHDFDEVIQDLIDKQHIIAALPDGFYLTDAGVQTWARLATENATVNNFDPQLKIWANWIMTVEDLLQVLDQEFKHLDRHIDYPVIKQAKIKDWIEIEGNVQRLKEYRITAAGIGHRHSLQEQRGDVCPLSLVS